MGRAKVYYKIGEVSEIVGVAPHVLRYWEKEFPQVRPRRLASQILYRKEDIACLLKIKELLYTKGYTIKGAKSALRKSGGSEASRPGSIPLLQHVKEELVELYKILSREP